MLPIPTPEMIERYSRPGPRYTSYPPATEFTPQFGLAQLHERLAAADAVDAPLSLYFHIPFCVEMCRFCGCNVVATRDRSRADAYLDQLEREADLWCAHLPRRRTFSQLHWGGGTPTFLDPAQIRRLHSIITSRFTPTRDAELAVEVDPAVTTVEQIETLGALGFNRMSAGIQDLDPVVQKTANRIQSEEQTRLVIDTARRCGVGSVNVDLMYGLPFQRTESYRDTVRRVLAMKPDRFALFGYAHVPWMKPQQRLMPEEKLPNAVERVELFVTAARMLEEAGYRQIGLDHFAHRDDPLSRAQVAGTLGRNFQGYTTTAAPDVLAMGVSAISDIGGAFVQCAHRLGDWEEAIADGRLPVERGLRRTADDELRGAFIRNTMCMLRLDLAPLQREFGAAADDLYAAARPALEPLAADDLLRFRADGFDVTELGRLFLRNIAMVFDGYLALAGTRRAFSKTV